MKYFKPRIWCILLILNWGIIPTFGQGSEPMQNRAPVFAGSFYPAQRQALESNLKQLFEKASPMEFEGLVQTLIVPHAGYPYSGIVAASAYKSVPRDVSYRNIFIIASSHREQFPGASVYDVGNYQTPLGEVEVNRELGKALIEQNRFISYNPKAHDREHSIEVQLPFLQYYFGELPPIVPIVMGSSTVAAARDLAAALHPYFTAENLFIISSDFSHYPSYQDAIRIDRLTAEAIEKKDPETFYSTLRKNSREGIPGLVTSTCGWSSILTMLYLADTREEIEITPVLYRNSGDSGEGDKNRVVGYWAIAGHMVDTGPEAFMLSPDDKQILLELSRNTLKSYVEEGEIYQPDVTSLPPALRQPAGAFVSLYAGDRLRGCIGNFNPDEPLWFVVQEMTISAATRDPRFAPVEAPELTYIQIEISVLTPLQKIESIDEFQLGKQGIYITKNGKSGTYLPQVAEDTGWDKEEFLGHCSREKAGIGWEGWKTADLYTYEAIVFKEGNKE